MVKHLVCVPIAINLLAPKSMSNLQLQNLFFLVYNVLTVLTSRIGSSVSLNSLTKIENFRIFSAFLFPFNQGYPFLSIELGCEMIP